MRNKLPSLPLQSSTTWREGTPPGRNVTVSLTCCRKTDTMFRSGWYFVGLATLWLNIHHVAMDQTVCSDYLVSGLYGVDDLAFNASNTHHMHKVYRARLYDQGSGYSGWAPGPDDTSQYIQVEFPMEVTVDTIMVQGRHDLDHWVRSYYLSYSLDGVMWALVTSPDHQPRLFPGSVDRDTIEKSSLEPSITAKFLRINPRSWKSHIVLQFDASGCYQIPDTGNHSEFSRLPMLPAADQNQHLLFESQSQTLPSCCKQCYKEDQCVALTFDNNQRTCRGFRSSVTCHHAPLSSEAPYLFMSKGLLEAFGFRQILSGMTPYRVNERALIQSNAADKCVQQYSQLIKIKSRPEMTLLQNVIAGNRILIKENNRLFVSGQYVTSTWQYSGTSAMINGALWSPQQPDPGQGHCVMLTQEGLSSVKCTEKLFSICGLF